MRIVLEWSCASLTVVQTLSCVWLFATPQTVAHKSPLSIISQNLLKFISLCQWCSLTISSSADPFFFCPRSFPALQSFPVSQLFASGGQSIRTSASASVLPMNIQGWFPLRLTGLISFQGLSRVFSSTTIQKHQFSSAQPSLWSNSYIHIWLPEKS